MALRDITGAGPSPACKPKMASMHVVKFWDTSRRPLGPVAIDFLAADSLSDAVAKAGKRLRILKKKYRGRVGYRIEDNMGHVFRSW